MHIFVAGFLLALAIVGGQVFAADSDSISTTAKVSVCGDLIVEGPEDCEPGPPENLNGASCQSLGSGTGILSCTVACQFNTAQCTPAGGGGGGLPFIPITFISTPVPAVPDVRFQGFADSGSVIFVLKDAFLIASGTVDTDATFQIDLIGVAPGSYLFSLYEEKLNGERSALRLFPLNIQFGTITNVSDIFFQPRIPFEEGISEGRVDFNEDGRVDLIDFSILIFWLDAPSPPTHIDLDMNGVVDLVDFSILAYRWTG